jgi:hypothetical protein
MGERGHPECCACRLSDPTDRLLRQASAVLVVASIDLLLIAQRSNPGLFPGHLTLKLLARAGEILTAHRTQHAAQLALGRQLLLHLEQRRLLGSVLIGVCDGVRGVPGRAGVVRIGLGHRVRLGDVPVSGRALLASGELGAATVRLLKQHRRQLRLLVASLVRLRGVKLKLGRIYRERVGVGLVLLEPGGLPKPVPDAREALANYCVPKARSTVRVSGSSAGGLHRLRVW